MLQTARRAADETSPPSSAARDDELEGSLASLKLALALAVFLVFVVMAMQFESLIHPFVILLTVPLGVIGVVAALWI